MAGDYFFVDPPRATEMIAGLRFRVPSGELEKHLIERSEYHKQRADEKIANKPKLQEALEHIKSTHSPVTVSHMSKGSYNLDPEDAVEQLEKDITMHTNKSLVFSYFAKHLFQQDYMLSKSEMVDLEILRN